MTALRLEGQSWWVKETQRELETRELILRFLAGELDGTSLCCNQEDPDWKSIKQRFQLIGPYVILRKLGEGAFGVVYLGIHRDSLRDNQQPRLLALKSPTEALLDRFINAAKKSEDPQLSETENKEALRSWAKLQLGELFSKEAALTARFAQCPYVVDVLDHSISVPYLALEFCNQGSLADRLRKPYQLKDVLDWGLQLSKALVVAHSLNPRVVHRDLKPENVLVHNNQLKIGDLGTSQLLQDTSSLRSLKGGFTPSYAAPEAFDAKAYPATDIWSLGVMLYEFVSGTLPFKGESMASLMKAITVSSPTKLTDGGRVKAPQSLIQLIDDCLQKEASERPSAQDCLERLQELIEPSQGSPKKRDKGKLEATEESKNSGGGRSLALVLGVMVTLIIVAALIIHLSSPDPVNQEPKKSVKVEKRQGEEESKTLRRSELKALLRDVKLWDKARPEHQDQCVQYILTFLGSAFQLESTANYSCETIKHRIARVRHKDTGLIFHLIPGGSFKMGGAGDLAKPIRNVTIRRPFLISPTELSQKQWLRLGGSLQVHEAMKRPDFPIHSLNREEMERVLARSPFRLPSESEWEYACRAGSTTLYFWGDKPDDRYSWHCENKAPGQRFQTIQSVDSHFRVGRWNAFGLCDMPGGVWEFCQDHWMNDYQSGPLDERPRIYASEQERAKADAALPKARRGRGVMRGGSWYGPPSLGASAVRNSDEWHYESRRASFKVGLRLAMSIDGFPAPSNR